MAPGNAAEDDLGFLSVLPENATHLVLDYLSARTLKRLRRVCKRARAIVNERVHTVTISSFLDLQQLAKQRASVLFPFLQRFQLHHKSIGVNEGTDGSPGTFQRENFHEQLGDLVLQSWEDRLPSLQLVSFKHVNLDDTLLYLTVHMDAHLASLALEKCDMGRHGTKALCKLTNLTSLTLLNSSGVDYTVLHKLTNLRHLTCHSPCACENVPAVISCLTKLETLELGDMPLEHLDLSTLSSLQSLRSLNLQRCVLERALVTLVAPQHLTMLDLSGSIVACDTLPHVAQACPQLQDFTVTFDKVLDFDMPFVNTLLRHCGGLTRLVFEDLAQVRMHSTRRTSQVGMHGTAHVPGGHAQHTAHMPGEHAQHTAHTPCVHACRRGFLQAISTCERDHVLRCERVFLPCNPKRSPPINHRPRCPSHPPPRSSLLPAGPGHPGLLAGGCHTPQPQGADHVRDGAERAMRLPLAAPV